MKLSSGYSTFLAIDLCKLFFRVLLKTLLKANLYTIFMNKPQKLKLKHFLNKKYTIKIEYKTCKACLMDLSITQPMGICQHVEKAFANIIKNY